MRIGGRVVAPPVRQVFQLQRTLGRMFDETDVLLLGDVGAAPVARQNGAVRCGPAPPPSLRPFKRLRHQRRRGMDATFLRPEPGAPSVANEPGALSSGDFIYGVQISTRLERLSDAAVTRCWRL
jgi:hypothetical protein